MSTTPDPLVPPPDDDIVAGEYVLGVLDAAERGAAQDRLERDDRFAQRVARWEAHFAPWLFAAPPLTASDFVWARIRRSLGWTDAAPAKRGAWDSVGLWRALAGLAAAAAVLMAVIPRAPGPGTAPVADVERPADGPVTALARDDGSTGWLARVDAHDGRLVVLPAPGATDAAGRANELWIIPAGGAPHSLGRLTSGRARTIELPEALRAALAVGATLAVTLEDPAGIPHAAPQGPIIAKGVIESI